MKKAFLIFSLLIASWADSQELKNDTIECGSRQLILQLPEESIDHAKRSHYEEGFWKYYSLNDGSFIVVHHGALAEMLLPKPDSVIYDCKLSNGANSILLLHDGKYYRRDRYPGYGTSVLYYFVKEDKYKLANDILDNVRFLRAEKSCR